MSEIDPHAQVSHTQDGRTLTGVGETVESLQETMDERAPVEEVSADARPSTGSAPAPAAPVAEGQPRPTRGQARFSELTKERDEAKARADAAERRAAEIEARLSQAPAAPPSSSPAAQIQPSVPNGGVSGQPQSSQPTRPEPTEDEIGPGLKYETYGAFVKDQNKWGWEQQQASIDQRVRQGIEVHQNQLAFQTHVEKTREKGRAIYKDFDAMLKSGPGTYVNMPSSAVMEIYGLPNSEHVQYAIMKDGALAHRLAALAATNPYAFGLELAKIAPVAPAAPPASTGTSGSATPPPPMQPVGAGSTTTRPSSADAETFQEYQSRRHAERGGSRRR